MSDSNPFDTPSEVVKKPYQKPELMRVALRPDEAVLGNCKVTMAACIGNASIFGS